MKEPASGHQRVSNQVGSHFHWLSQYRDLRDFGDSRGFDPSRAELPVARAGGRIGALDTFENLDFNDREEVIARDLFE
jgi:hypothetical protein